MKMNSTVVLTFILLVMMFGTGLMSAAWGLVIGREALKGITQPDTRPANNLASRQGNSSHRDNFTLLKEDEIITNVKNRINGDRKPNSPAPESKAPKATNVVAKTVQFPLVSQSRGVVLEVGSVRRDGDSLVLKVSLRNTSKEPVRFLYSFLTIKDEKGRELAANTDGLPPDLPSSGEAFSGTISIPTSPLDNVEKLSLSLTDFPDQRLQLQLSDIPVR